jgi:large subunit ribosomal protein L2
MAKRLYSQRAGRGSNTFKAKLGGIKSQYANKSDDLMKGEIIDFVKDTGRNAIIAKIKFDNGTEQSVVASEGTYVGQKVEQGPNPEWNVGNVSEIGNLPEGCPVFNIEKVTGDGGTLVKSSGSYALLITKDSKKATVKMPSGRLINLPLNVRATIGNVSAGGKREKPFVKAGAKYFATKAKKIFWPKVRGVAMNAVDHPFGGMQHHAGKSKSTSKNAPVGRKVGAIGSKRTGRRKKN